MKKMQTSVAQITSFDGDIERNLSHAYEMATDAAKKGAELVLFPEFMSQGYRLTTEIWNSAEKFNGPTTSWLKATSKELNLCIGSTFLEAKNGHFYNTFAFAEPSGNITGIVRKRYPSMWEAYFFKSSDGEHVFETSFGRVGVGICFDNHTHKVASLIRKGKPDIVLMPHSYCTPVIANKLASAADIERLKNLPLNVARLYNEILGVPVVMCNKSGNWDSPVPNKIFGTPTGFRFSGKSAIINADGTILAEMNDEEGIATGKVSFNPEHKKDAAFPKFSRYVYRGPAGREIIRLMEFQGYLNYSFSCERKNKSLLVSEK